MSRFLMTSLALLLAAFPLRGGESMDAPKGNPVNPQEKRLVERASAYLVKVMAELPSQKKRYVVTGLAINRDSILTSALISRNGDERITVITASGRKIDSHLVGFDPQSSLALLKLKNGNMDFPGKTAQVATGDTVWIMAAFYQNFPSVFRGVVSNADSQHIIINAPAIPGGSGGAVVTADGALAGIIRGRLGVSWNRDLRIRNEETELFFAGDNPVEQPLLYALPISSAQRIASDLAEYGRLRQAWVGVWCRQTDEENRIQVTDVTADSPADKAGLKSGDFILSLDRKSVKRIIDLQKVIFDKRPVDRLSMRIDRDGKEKDLDIHVAEAPQLKQATIGRSLPNLPRKADETWILDLASPAISSFGLMRFKSAPNLGLIGNLIGKETARRAGIIEGYGIRLQEVLSESPFSALNLLPGDVIVEVDGRPIRSYTDLESITRTLDTVHPEHNGEKQAVVRYYRDGKPRSDTILIQAEPLKADEIRELRSRMDQVSSFLRDQEFRNLNNTLQRLRNLIEGKQTFDRSGELKKMEERIEAYRRQSKERIEAEYRYLMETVNQLKKAVNREE